MGKARSIGLFFASTSCREVAGDAAITPGLISERYTLALREPALMQESPVPGGAYICQPVVSSMMGVFPPPIGKVGNTTSRESVHAPNDGMATKSVSFVAQRKAAVPPGFGTNGEAVAWPMSSP